MRLPFFILVAYALYVLASACITSTETGRHIREMDRSVYRVHCPRCKAPPWHACVGMRYETHVARDQLAVHAPLDDGAET